MSTDNAHATAVQCAACQAQNGAEAKFCRGCGHSLYESCGKCTAAVLLDQRFCGDCGADLKKLLSEKQAKYDSYLADAVAAAKQSDFENALDLLQRVAEVEDFRFKASSDAAKQAIKQVQGLHDKSVGIAQQRIQAAMLAHEQGDRMKVVSLLSNLPQKLLDEETRVILAKTQAFLDQTKVLEEELTKASQEKNWKLAGSLIQQLLGLQPDHEPYKKASERVAARLLNLAQKLYAKQRYSSAADHLAAIPERNLSEDSHQLREAILNSQWLDQAIQAEPYASPTLGRLAVRFAKLVPDDPEAPNVVKALSQQLKQGKRDPRCHFPPWRGSTKSWLGGEAKHLTRPRSFDIDDENEVYRKHLGQFNVAIGLAVGALGFGRTSEDLSGRKKKLFGKKKSRVCWGMDVGGRSFKAIRAEVVDDKLQVTDFYRAEYGAALTSLGKISDLGETLKPVVEAFLEMHDLSDAIVWSNLPASDTVTRFVRLPPVVDKQADRLLDTEIRERVPISEDEMLAIRTISPLNKEDSLGRAASVTVTRKKNSEQRLSILEEAGLKVDGLQSDSLALVNFAAHEFADFFARDGVEAGEGDAGEDNEPNAHHRYDEKTPTIALVESGATSTTLMFISAETHWFWTVEVGGNDLDSALARATKLTQSQAEQLKLDPARLPSPAHDYEAVERRMNELRARLERIRDDAMDQNSRFDVAETWSMGGCALAHQWHRRVLSDEVD